MNKTHVMVSRKCQKPVQKAARWLCGTCGRGVGIVIQYSVLVVGSEYTKKCSGIKGSMYKVMKSFICTGCSNPVISTCYSSVDTGASANLEVVDSSP